MVCYALSLYHLEVVLLDICMHEGFAVIVRCSCRKRSDKGQGHDDAQSHDSLVVQQLLAEKIIPVITLSSYLTILLRVTFGCYPVLVWASKEHVSQHWRTSNWMQRPNWKIPKMLSASAPNNGIIDRKSVCARALGKRCGVSYHYIAIPPFRELFYCPSYTISVQIISNVENGNMHMLGPE
jgi:hypothetical protein